MLLLYACAPRPHPPPAVEPPIEPSPWLGVEAIEEPVRWTAAEQELAVDEIIAAILAASPRVVHDAFDGMMVHRESACPQSEERPGQLVVAGDCTTSTGWTWLGIGSRASLQNMRIVLGDIDAFHHEWEFANGNVRLLGPDAEAFELTGMTLYRDYDGDRGVRLLSVEMWGEFGARGVDALAGTWFEDDLAVELYFDAEVGGDATLTGGMSRMSGTAWAWATEGMSLTADCPSEPTGTLMIQDQAGGWYAVELDASACDGCGVSEGVAVCADFTPLVAFQEDPWAG